MYVTHDFASSGERNVSKAASSFRCAQSPSSFNSPFALRRRSACRNVSRNSYRRSSASTSHQRPARSCGGGTAFFQPGRPGGRGRGESLLPSTSEPPSSVFANDGPPPGTTSCRPGRPGGRWRGEWNLPSAFKPPSSFNQQLPASAKQHFRAAARIGSRPSDLRSASSRPNKESG